jgi:hypothetical protein
MKRLLIALSTRKCRPGCASPGIHDGHLTWIGNLRYTR